MKFLLHNSLSKCEFSSWCLRRSLDFQVKTVEALEKKVVQIRRLYKSPNFQRHHIIEPPTRQVPCNEGEIDEMLALYVSFVYYGNTFIFDATVQKISCTDSEVILEWDFGYIISACKSAVWNFLHRRGTSESQCMSSKRWKMRQWRKSIRCPTEELI